MDNDENFKKSKKSKILGYIIYAILAIFFCLALCMQNFLFEEKESSNQNAVQTHSEKVENKT